MSADRQAFSWAGNGFTRTGFERAGHTDLRVGTDWIKSADMLNCSPKSIGKLKDLTAKKLGVSGGQIQYKLQNIAIL